MSTDFSFETVFRAPSVETVLAAYFDPDHLAAQDKVADLGDRAVLEQHEDDKIRSATWSVHAMKTLPLYVKPFIEGGRLAYRESMTWRKADNEIDMTVIPQILGGRVKIAAVYQLAQIGEGQVRRRYKGTITVDVRLISSKIEKGILAEIEKGMPMMTECTQRWLSRTP
jgi:hypothetical protein